MGKIAGTTYFKIDGQQLSVSLPLTSYRVR